MLPQEIIEEIVDLHQHNPSVLKACALTAREFVPRTRTYLFHRLVINNERGRLPSVYNGLFKDNYIVLNAVTHVQLCIDPMLANWSDAEAKALSDSLLQFTNLEHMSITSTRLNTGIANAIFVCAPCVKTLVLNNVEFHWETITNFTSHFSSVETIQLHGIFITSDGSQDFLPIAPEDPSAARTYPRTLIWTAGIDGQDVVPLFFRRNFSLRLSKIETLGIMVQATDHHLRAHMFTLLEQFVSLRRLTIIPRPSYTVCDGAPGALTSIRHCLCLSHQLTVDCYIPGGPTSTRESTASFWFTQQSLCVWLAYAVLTTLQCKLDLLELTLYIDEHCQDDSRADFWNSFDVIVVGQLTPALPTSICIWISGDQGLALEEHVFEDMRDFLQTHLPLLQASGALSVRSAIPFYRPINQ